MVRQQVAGMQRMMPDLGETLGLDDAGVERFLTALSEAQLRETERRASLGPAGSAFGAGTNPRAAVEESLAADFGADTVARWREYQAALPARSMVRNLQMSLVDADLALSKDQRQQMVGVYGRAMTEATPAQVPGSVRVAGPAAAGMVRPPALAPEQLAEMRTRQIEMVQARNARISQEARSILSTEQQAVLERHLRSELDMQRQAFEMMSSSRPAAAAPPP
jgi:hypothetical protein